MLVSRDWDRPNHVRERNLHSLNINLIKYMEMDLWIFGLFRIEIFSYHPFSVF